MIDEFVAIMETDGSMMEASSVGLEEEGDEIELSLGLSIGGRFKSTKLNPEEKKTTNAEADLILQTQLFSGHSMTQALVGDSEAESGAECVDPLRKREIHALKRQEARRKREDKMRKRGLMTGSGFSEDNMLLEAQRVEVRARDREMRENEPKIEGRECKREGNVEREHSDLMLKPHGAQNLSQGSGTTTPSPIPVVQYPPLQYVPFGNGFAYPCVVPFLAPSSSNGGNEKIEENVQQPVACRSFWSCQGSLGSGNFTMGGSDSEYNVDKDGGIRNAEYPVCGSSAVSENRCSSQQGGSSSSSDTGSHSSDSKPEQSQLKYACENSVPSYQTDMSSRAKGKEITHNTDKAVSPHMIQSSTTKHIEPTDSEALPNADNKPITPQSPNPGPLKVASDQGLHTPSQSQMPCVSTTGNGPNGKTITGFLYRYTKTEVSIVCVCHGSSFSPAEFVEHAGGKDITHPLRHITVIPSAF